MTTEHDAPVQVPPPPVAVYAQADRRDRFVDDPRRKSVMLAVLLGLMPGLGHIYVGYYREAFRNIAVVCGIITGRSTGLFRHGLEAPAGIFLAFYLLFNLVDAGRRASLYNQALAGLRPMDLPDDLVAAPGRGSLVGGAVLVAAGVLFLSNTLFDIPMYWVQRWWPMGFILGGAWLIYLDMHGRTKTEAHSGN
jgi:hypothetical protein